MKKVLIAAFAVGIMATAVNAQTAPAEKKAQTTTTTTEKQMVEKKEMAPKKTVKHHKTTQVHAVKSGKPATK